MRTLFTIFFLLLIASPLYSQELEEWYSLSNTSAAGVSYLPGFSAEGGMNAITVGNMPNSPTWFNRFPFDTVNQFSWSPNKGSAVVNQADFNGDGIMDYIDFNGFVYKGIQKNQPPEKTPVAQYKFTQGEFSSQSQYSIMDVNKDGNDDMVICEQSSGASAVLLGDRDLTKMKMVSIEKQSNPQEIPVCAFANSEGKARRIIYRTNLETKFEGFALQSINIRAANDTLKADVFDLHNIGHYSKNYNSSWYFFNLPSAHLYTSKKYNELSFIFRESHDYPVMFDTNRVYNIENDSMKYALSYPVVITPAWFGGLNTSVDEDDKEDHLWVDRQPVIKGNKLFPRYRILSGNPSEENNYNKTIGYFTGLHCGGIRCVIKAIGDITGDGIGDIIEVEDYNCVTIYKGRARQTTKGVEEKANFDFTIHSSEPNPIGKDRNALLPITIEQPCSYTLTLYDISGKSICEIFKGELPFGDIKIPLTLISYNLSAGFYTLRLSDGKHTSDRGILLTN